jgi:signal transduction histidine kinase
VTFALILKYLDEEYQTSVWKGVADAASRIGADLVCVQGAAFDRLARGGAGDFSLARIVPLDGALVLSSLFTDHRDPRIFEAIRSSLGGIPIVSVGVALEGVPSLVVDVEGALRDLVAHLVDAHGYRRVLYAGGPVMNRDNAARERVIREELSRPERLRIGCSFRAVNGALFSETEGKRLAAELARESPGTPPDAIVAGSDDMAMGILKQIGRSAESAWRNVPVTGIDDIPLAATGTFALTTVSQPLEELGKRALETLARLASGERVPSLTEIHARLVLRNSCGCSGFAPVLPVGPDDSGAFREQLLAEAGRLGQELMACEDSSALERPLSDFLAAVGARSFSLVSFPSPDDRIPASGTLSYAYGAEREGNAAARGMPVALAEHVAAALARPAERDEPGRFSLVPLRSGSECLGLALYEIPEDAHPFMCGCCLSLAHALKRFDSLERERTRARDLEAEVARRTAQLENESRRRMQVEEEVLRISDLERLRFSVDLHDDICQRLAAMTMVCKNFADQDPAMRMLLEMASGTLQRTRRYAHDSFPFELDSMDLTESLRDLCASLDGTSGCAVRFEFDPGIDARLSRDQKLDALRIAREAVGNALAHARASTCAVSLRVEGDGIALRVADDGEGDPAIAERTAALRDSVDPAAATRRPRGIGMRSMEYRAHRLGATFAVASSRAGGTAIEIRIPGGERKQ